MKYVYYSFPQDRVIKIGADNVESDTLTIGMLTRYNQSFKMLKDEANQWRLTWMGDTTPPVITTDIRTDTATSWSGERPPRR